MRVHAGFQARPGIFHLAFSKQGRATRKICKTLVAKSLTTTSETDSFFAVSGIRPGSRNLKKHIKNSIL